MDAIVEKRFEYKGLPCVILFNPLGYRTGYVGVPKGKKIDITSIECHGGITFKEKNLMGRKDRWEGSWIGFDCGHAGDGRDPELTAKYWPDNKLMAQVVEGFHRKFPGPAKSLKFCEEECKGIADQIHDQNVIGAGGTMR